MSDTESQISGMSLVSNMGLIPMTGVNFEDKKQIALTKREL